VFDHVVFGVSDYAASKAFFLKALAPLGVVVVSEGPLGVELCRPSSKASLCIRLSPEQKPSHLHLAFTAENRQQVQAFYRAALEAGAKDNGHLVCARATTQTTMRPSSLVPTATTLKSSATSPRPNPSLHPQCYSGLRPLPPSGELKR
jgi:hypothetical protein